MDKATDLNKCCKVDNKTANYKPYKKSVELVFTPSVKRYMFNLQRKDLHSFMYNIK